MVAWLFASIGTSGSRVLPTGMPTLLSAYFNGIGLLVTLLVRANRQRQQLLACGLNDHYRQIFELTRLDEAVAIHANEAEALAAVAG